MYAVIRSYSGPGAKELFDVLEEKKSEVERLIRAANGAVGYTLIRTVEGGVSVTVCQNKAAAEESVKVAADWVRTNSSTGARVPRISEGETIVHFQTSTKL